jgi:hypothetical protein
LALSAQSLKLWGGKIPAEQNCASGKRNQRQRCHDSVMLPGGNGMVESSSEELTILPEKKVSLMVLTTPLVVVNPNF